MSSLSPLALGLLSSLGVTLASLGGLALLSLSADRLQRLTFFLVSLAMGGLFGDVALHLLPAIFSQPGSAAWGSFGILGGIVSSFALEKFLRWRHAHGLEHEAAHGHRHAIKPVGRLLLVSDGLHNLLDGVVIGASFLAGPAIGAATTLAVLLHEIPHEIGDFAVLVDAGYTRRQALLFNFACGLFSIAGVALAFVIGKGLTEFTTFTLAITAGFFLYIAGANLTPEMQKEQSPGKSLLQLGGMIAGAGLMMLLLLIE